MYREKKRGGEGEVHCNITEISTSAARVICIKYEYYNINLRIVAARTQRRMSLLCVCVCVYSALKCDILISRKFERYRLCSLIYSELIGVFAVALSGLLPRGCEICNLIYPFATLLYNRILSHAVS